MSVFQPPHCVAVLRRIPTLCGRRAKPVNPDGESAAAVLERFPTLVSRRVIQANPDDDPTHKITLAD